MKRIIVGFGLICIAWAGIAFGLSAQEQVTERVVIMPPDFALPVIAYQPDCPLKIEEVKLFSYLSGGGGSSTTVRNKGTKPIRSYTIGAWNTVGTGGWFEQPVKGTLLPGQVDVPSSGEEVEVVELTESLREQLKLSGGMKAVVVFMVVRVEYADGSVYNDEPIHEALKTHLDSIAK